MIQPSLADKTDREGEPDIDWCEVYTILIAHTNMSYEEVSNRTIPVLNGILTALKKHIEIKVGIPGMFGGLSTHTDDVESPKPTGKVPKISEFLAFASGFNK